MHYLTLIDQTISVLTNASPLHISHLTDQTGLYALVDHTGNTVYVGMTDTSFKDRISYKHVTGSESHSHMFSKMYNTGRMWRSKHQPDNERQDAKIAKRVRTKFIREHCRAIIAPLPLNKSELFQLERIVLEKLPAGMTKWNSASNRAVSEPVELLNETIAKMELSGDDLAALDRQAKRFSMGA